MSTSTSVSPTPISSAAAEPAAGVFPACVNLLGRLALAALFLPAGLNKISAFDGTVAYIQSVGLPLAALGAVLASVFFHAYWAAPADQAFVQQLMFFKNLGVIGGLLVLAAAAPGSWSLDGRR